MLLHIAIGDAYGMGFEFAELDALRIRKNDGLTYYPHPYHPIDPGHYTDDTQMSLAVAETIITHGAIATRKDFAEAFLRSYHRDPRLGYASGFQKFLDGTRTAEEFLTNIRPISDGAGSAMRACPIGFLHSIHDVLRIAEIQARITHDTPAGIAAAQGVAAMSHWAIYEGKNIDRSAIRERLRRMNPVLDEALQAPHRRDVSNAGLPALNAALGVVETAETYRDALIKSVDYTGDVDTVAAVAMGVLSNILPEGEEAMPNELLFQLEDGSYGREYLQNLDERLRKEFIPS